MASVSNATVSRVFSGADAVRADTRTKVLAAARSFQAQSDEHKPPSCGIAQAITSSAGRGASGTATLALQSH